MPEPKERVIEQKLVKWCHEHNCLCYKLTSPGRRGLPDRMVMGRGKTIFIELKQKGKRPTEQQFFVMGEMTDYGGVVCRWFADPKEMISFLRWYFLV